MMDTRIGHRFKGALGTALVAGILLAAVAPGAVAGTRPPQTSNGECLLTTIKPITFPDPDRVGAKAQLNCVHVGGLQAQVQLWRSAGVKGVKGDILLSDAGWTTVVLLHGKGAARADDVLCADLPASGSYYIRARLRSTVPGKPGIKTSAWVRGPKATLTC